MLNNRKGVPTLDRKAAVRDLRSPLLLCAALLLSAATLMAVPGLTRILTQEGRDAFYLILLIREIDPAAYHEWFALYCTVYAVGFLGAVLGAVGLWVTLLSTLSRKEQAPAEGPTFFLWLARCYHLLCWAAAVGLGGLFGVRVVLYFLKEAFRVGGFLFIAAMLLPELVFAAVTAIAVISAIRMTGGCVRTLENIRDNIRSGECRSYSMTEAAPRLCWLTGLASLVIAALHKNEPVLLLSFAAAGAADVLLGIWLHRYRCRTDRRIYAAAKASEGKPVSFDI